MYFAKKSSTTYNLTSYFFYCMNTGLCIKYTKRSAQKRNEGVCFDAIYIGVLLKINDFCKTMFPKSKFLSNLTLKALVPRNHFFYRLFIVYFTTSYNLTKYLSLACVSSYCTKSLSSRKLAENVNTHTSDAKTNPFITFGSGIFSSPEPRAHGELIVYQSSRRPSVRASVCASVRPCVHTFKH